MKCPKCAEEIQPTAKVCRHCGAKFTPNYMGIGCLALVVLFVILIVAGSPRNNDTVNTILAAQKACEAQTGHKCDVP